MIENLVFSLNATVPVFLLMVVGYMLKKLGLLDDVFANKLNGLVFKVGLPVLLFKELSVADFYEIWDTTFVLFCFISSLLSIIGSVVVAKSVKEPHLRGEFAQAAYRSSAALLGCAFVENIYGNAGPAALMIVGAVPLYNIGAVVVLNRMRKEGEKWSFQVLKETLLQVMSNPIIIGIGIGFLWSALRLDQPVILEKTVSSIAALATPLGLMSLGATFDFTRSKAMIKTTVIGSFFKLVVFVMIFIPIAVGIGFRQEKLVAVLVMLGGATTVSCFIMARNSGYEGVLTSGIVVLTTLASAFTLTLWLFLLRSLMLI